jgi:SAM-dependent methyltransferase
MARPVGTGPGELTPDGCAVDLYALLKPRDEPSVIHPALPPGGSILELGCGTGRILRPLAELGHPVFGVDESPAMLAHLADLPTSCSPIEALRLDRTFDAVLLASTLINSEPEQRRAFLAACARHVRPGGVVVVQQHRSEWFDTAEPFDVTDDGIRWVFHPVRRDGSGLTAVIEYHVDGRVWTHAFTAHRIGDEELTADLASAGLRFDRWLTEDRAWFAARPA